MSSIRALSLVLCLAAPVVACSASVDDDSTQSNTQALECDASGTWAIKIATPVKWNASFVLQGGTGVVNNWLLSTRTQNGLTVTDSAELCGVETPDYQAAALFGGEKYGAQFPEQTFGTLPKFPLTGTLTSTGVGASFAGPASAALVGATLANPTTDAWPNVASIVTVDVDNDGKPGVSVDAKTGPGLSLPPVNATRSVRADRVYTAFRQVLAATSGTVTSCTRVDGKGQIAVIAGKAAIDQHVVGCRHASDGAECNGSEYKLLDSAAPVHQPTGDAIITMVKLPSNSSPTCASVRAIDFAAAP